MSAAGRSTLPSLLVLSATVANGVASQGLLSPLIENAKHDLGMSDFQLGLVQGLAVSIPIAILAIPLGRMVDRANRLRLLIALAVIWTIGNVITALAPDFTVLFAARMLAGVGMMCALPVAISIAADLSEQDHRGRAVLLLSLGRIVGAALAFGLGGWLLGVYAAAAAVDIGNMAPWRAVHLVFAAGSAVLILPLFLLREPARREQGEAASAPLGAVLKLLWQRRALLAPLFLGQLTVTMADASAGMWAAPVLVRDYGQQPGEFGPWLGAVVLFSGIIGSVVGGICADLAQKGRIPGGLLAGAALAALISIPAAFFAVMPTAAGFGWMLFVLLVGGSITGLVTVVATTVFLPNEVRGVCLGAFIVIAAIVALGIAPTLVSLISDALGGESHVREGLTAVVLGTSVISAAGFLAALRAEHRRG